MLDLACARVDPLDMVVLHDAAWVIVASPNRLLALSTAPDGPVLQQPLGAAHEHELQAGSAAPSPAFVKLAAVANAPRTLTLLLSSLLLTVSVRAVFYLATNSVRS